MIFDANLPAVTIERRAAEEMVPLSMVEQLAAIADSLEERIAALEVGSRAAAAQAVLDALGMA
jgi:hypothetical protein